MKNEKNIKFPVGGRIALIIFSYIIVVGMAQIIGMIVAGIPFSGKKALENMSLQQIFILQIFTFFAIIFIVVLFRKYLDRESIKSLGLSLKGRANDISSGFFIALFIMGGGFLILYFGGYIKILHVQIHLSELLLSLLLLFLVAFEEEILIRGYILNNLLTVTNKYIALIISSVIFSLFHVLNYDISWFSMINLFLAGILLGSSYIFTKNLWFPISLHLFWNFFQGPVLGFSVSGQNFGHIITIKDIGNPIINGGKFGFEGSALCTAALLLTIPLIIFFFENRTKKVITPKERGFFKVK